MNGELRLASRRQMFRSLLGLSVGERLLSSPRELSEHDIREAIKYGRKWHDGNNFLVDGLESYRNWIADIGDMRITVTFLTDWARIALASALLKMDGKQADPSEWRSVARAGRLVTMVLIVSPGLGQDARSKRLYGDGKAYSVLRIGGNTITPIRDDASSQVEPGQIPGIWVPTAKRLEAMIHDTKDSEAEFTRILPEVTGPSHYQLVFLLNSYQLDRDQWGRRAEFLLFDGSGRKESAKVNLSKLR